MSKFDSDFISNSSEDEPKNEQQDINSELEKREPLNALFYCCGNCSTFFKDYNNYEEYSKLVKHHELPNKLVDGVKLYKNGLSEIINNLKPYIQKINEKERLQCKYLVLFYSLSNISQNNLFKPDIAENEKRKCIIKILQNSFKKKELNVSFLGIIPYYANLFVYVTFENKPNINNFYKTFELKDLNLDIDFVYKVIYNQAERY